jgi:hypothetical protein
MEIRDDWRFVQSIAKEPISGYRSNLVPFLGNRWVVDVGRVELVEDDDVHGIVR